MLCDTAASALLGLSARFVYCGEHQTSGWGFAVVAEEIRKLAESSKQSVNEIEALISAIRNDIDFVASKIDNMNATVKTSEESSKKVSSMFDSIVNFSLETSTMSKDIRIASRKLIEDSTVIVANIESIIVVSEQTASGAEELSTSSNQFRDGMESYFEKTKQLKEKSSLLKESLSRFTFS